METGINEVNQNIRKMRRDIELIKNILLSEGELSEYAKKELADARAEKEEEYTSLEEL
jgi:hypothetical protein